MRLRPFRQTGYVEAGIPIKTKPFPKLPFDVFDVSRNPLLKDKESCEDAVGTGLTIKTSAPKFNDFACFCRTYFSVVEK